MHIHDFGERPKDDAVCKGCGVPIMSGYLLWDEDAEDN